MTYAAVLGLGRPGRARQLGCGFESVEHGGLDLQLCYRRHHGMMCASYLERLAGSS